MAPSDVFGLTADAAPDPAACVYHDPVPCVYLPPAGALSVAALLLSADIGREKFRLLPFSVSVVPSATFDNLLVDRVVAEGGMLALSTLAPRPPLPAGVGDMIRCGGSRLADLFCEPDMFFGSAGTGGAS